ACCATWPASLTSTRRSRTLVAAATSWPANRSPMRPPWLSWTSRDTRRALRSASGKPELMELLQGGACDDLFRRFERTAFHLELQDSYHTPEEVGPFSLYLHGEPDDFAWHQPWLTLVREATRAGRRITRARIASVPHGDYTRWGLTVARLNIEA